VYLPQFKLSKLAAGIGSVLWFMAYAPQLQAQPRQIAPMIPLASTWPDYGRIATEQLETRVLAAQDANDSAFVRAWRNSTHEGHAEGGPLSSNLPRNVSAAEPFGRPDYPDGYDSEGCPGGDARFAVRAETVFHHATGSPDALPLDSAEFLDKAAGAVLAMHVHAGGSLENFVVTTHPDAHGNTPELRGKIVARVRAKRAPEPLTDAEHAELNEMLVELRVKPKRVRVRTKPLTAADIVEGGEYVPKRGNNKTPNLVVAAVSPDGSLIVWHRSNESAADCDSASTVAEFLALAARRVGV
jgi:hypothetical protein